MQYDTIYKYLCGKNNLEIDQSLKPKFFSIISIGMFVNQSSVLHYQQHSSKRLENSYSLSTCFPFTIKNSTLTL